MMSAQEVQPYPQLAALLETVAAYLVAQGGGMVPSSREPGTIVHAPFALLPRQVRVCACGASVSNTDGLPRVRACSFQPPPSIKRSRSPCRSA